MADESVDADAEERAIQEARVALSELGVTLLTFYFDFSRALSDVEFGLGVRLEASRKARRPGCIEGKGPRSPRHTVCEWGKPE